MAHGDRRRVSVVVAILGVLAATFAAFLVFGPEGDDGTTADGGPGDTRLVGSRSAQVDPAEPEVVIDAGDAFNVYASRNPFEPALSGGGSFPDGSDTGVDGDDPFAPDTTPTTDVDGFPTPTTGSLPGTATTPTSAPTFDPSRQTVTLLDVYDSNGVYRASVQVGATVYDVGAGETFGTRFRVVSLDDPCGQFLYGDSPFRLCEGEQVLK